MVLTNFSGFVSDARISKFFLLHWMVLAMAFGVASSAMAGSATYRLTVENNWTRSSYPIGYPGNAHFSWIGGGAHTPGDLFWSIGGIATPGLEKMAESGSTIDFADEIELAGGDPLEWHHWFCTPGPPAPAAPNCGSSDAVFTVDDAKSALTLTSMLGPSPDWFIGLSNYDLKPSGVWTQQTTVPVKLLDAGTEEGTTPTVVNASTDPFEPIGYLRYNSVTGDYTPAVNATNVGNFQFELLSINTNSTPTVVYPTAMSTLAGPTENFSWNRGLSNVTAWRVKIGSTYRGTEYHEEDYDLNTSATVDGLPTDGSTVYFTLEYQEQGSSVWLMNDFTYAASSFNEPQLVLPAANSLLAGGSDTFAWTTDTNAISELWLRVGSAFRSRDLHNQQYNSSTSALVSGLPTDGSMVYVTLWYQVTGTADWTAVDYQFTTSTDPGFSDAVRLGLSSNVTVDGVSYSASDIIQYDPSSDQWSLYFDASDVGLVGTNGFHLLDDNALPEMLFTVSTVQTVSGVGQVLRQDVLKFTPSSLGENTAGTFSVYLDGSTVGLTTSGEFISALLMSADGRLVISTEGNHTLPGLSSSGRDEDLVVLNTDGTWDVYLDGSDLLLSSSSEELWGASLEASTGDLLLTTKGNYNVPGDSSGKGGDILRCEAPVLGENSSCASLTEYFVGKNYGLGIRSVDSLSLGSGNDSGGGGVVTALAQDVTVELDGVGVGALQASEVDNGSTADAGIASLSVSPEMFSCNELGANTVTLTVTDDNGDSDTDQSTATVEDNVAPIAVGMDITVSLGAAGTASIEGLDLDNGSQDNCGIAALTVSPNSFTSADLGVNVVNLTVTDIVGNKSSTSVLVTVEEVAPPVSSDTLHISIASSGTVGGVAYSASDIIRYDQITGEWAMFFDASDVNIVGTNSFHLLDNTALPEMLMTMSTVQSVAGIGQVRRQDVVKFTPTSVGDVTAGTFSMFLDGSTVGLTTSGEFISAVMQAADGRLVISTEGNHILPGLSSSGRDEDLVVLNADDTWDVYLDGSDLVLTSSAEELWGATLDPGTGDLLLTTKGNYRVPGDLSGKGGDILRCGSPVLGENSSCASLTEHFIGREHGLGTRIVDAVSLGAGSGGGGTVTAIAQGVTVELDASGVGSITAAQVDNGSTADDGIASLSVTPNTFDCGSLFLEVPITLTVTDVNGVSDTDTAIVAPIDELPPIALGQDMTVVLDATGNASITVSDVDGGSTDNCGIVSQIVFPNDFTATDIGANIVELQLVDVAGNEATTSVTVTVEETPPASSSALYVGIASEGTAGGVYHSASDIIRFDQATGAWTMFFDASDVGLIGTNSFHLLDASALPEMLFTMATVQTVAGIGQVRRNDVIKFTPTSVGDNTAGTFSLFLDGSDYGLTTSGEFLSAVMMSGDGRLVVSTEGNHILPGLSAMGRDEDLVVLNNDGTWDVYLDGSDLLLTVNSEEIWGATRDPATGDLLLTTRANYSVVGDSGKGGDIFRCVSPTFGENSSCASITEEFVGLDNGLAIRIVDSLSLVQP